MKSSPVFGEIIALLQKHNIKYRLIEHKPVYTSQQAADIRGIPLSQGAKAMIFAADKKPILLVVPADRKVNTSLFKKTFKVKDLRLITPDQVTQLTGLTVGAIPPFGRLMGLATFVDRRLLANKAISFNPGVHTKSVTLKTTDYLKLEKPIQGKFSL